MADFGDHSAEVLAGAPALPAAVTLGVLRRPIPSGQLGLVPVLTGGAGQPAAPVSHYRYNGSAWVPVS
jgi:hypothetical protein